MLDEGGSEKQRCFVSPFIMEDLYHPRLKNTTYDAIVIGSGLGGITAAALYAKSKKKVLGNQQKLDYCFQALIYLIISFL